mgnify:CR=1 FL=1
MPKIEFTPTELKAYFTDRRTYHYCVAAREKEQDMRVHADGIFPEKLINERRPNESLEVLEYRKKIFVAKTKPYFNKIENTLQKIRRSSDWSIKYPEVSFDKIVEGEKMNDYAEKNYPVFESITNWAFSLLLRNYLIDANALILVAPMSVPQDGSRYMEPVVTIFNSCDVIDFAAEDYAVMVNRVGCVYGDNKPGKSFYIVTTVAIHRYDQINGRGEYKEAYYFEHGLGELPVFKTGGIVIDVYGSHSLYESRISGILPEFNEALREYSDLQAAKVLHLFPERWEYTQNECVKCKGTGQRMEGIGENACQVTCDTCHGQGYIATGPYSKMLIRPASADQLQLPTPPAGFVEKDVEIIKVQEQSVHDHIYNGLSAINFEFTMERPLATSGVKTAMDGDEANNMVHSIAEDLVKIIDRVYFFIALYRYSAQYTAEQIYEMLPMISVPEKYDILSTSFYQDQMKMAIDSKLSPAITNQMQVSYATKVFNNDLKIAADVALLLKLDPLAGIDEDTRNSRLTNKGITELDYIVSSNINKFVAELTDASPAFIDMDIVKQKEEVYKLAQAQMDAQEVVVKLPNDQGGIDPKTGKPIVDSNNAN